MKQKAKDTERASGAKRPARSRRAYRKKGKLLTALLAVTVMLGCMVAGAAAYANVGLASPRNMPRAEKEPMAIGVIRSEAATQTEAPRRAAEQEQRAPEGGGASAQPSAEQGVLDEQNATEVTGMVLPENAALSVSGDVVVNPRVDADITKPKEPEEEITPAELAAEEEDSPWRSMVFDADILPDTEAEAVSALQSRLMELGYMEHGTPDTRYGADTKLAVFVFQRNHEMEPTGTADVATLSVMMSDDAKMYQMSFNQEGEDIRLLQERLSHLGYAAEATGFFDGETEEMVMRFQETNGLVEDGVVTLGTKAVLFSDAALGYKGTPPSVVNVGVESMIAVAEQQLGKPYTLGAKGPNAFDCSGLVYYCLNQSGYQTGYMTSGDWANSAYATVSKMSDLARGDIVCFRGHVGIYLGDGRMLDASSGENRVRTTGDLFGSSYWTDNFICGKRVY